MYTIQQIALDSEYGFYLQIANYRGPLRLDFFVVGGKRSATTSEVFRGSVKARCASRGLISQSMMPLSASA